MANLIDKTIKELKWYLDTNEEKGVVYFPKFCIENMIKNLKQADTERHAHWCYRSTNRFYECGYCGNITYSSEDKYCSNCGCKMDEVEK